MGRRLLRGEIRWKVPKQNPFETTEAALIKKVDDLEREVRRLSTLAPVFTVLNENTPAQLTASVNDYDPGNYDVLRMNGNSGWFITGISGGVKGRMLIIINVGPANVIALSHESASSSAANRIFSPTAANVTLSVGDGAYLYYDSTSLRWRVIAGYSLS